MDLDESHTYDLVLNLGAYFPGFLYHQDMDAWLQINQSDKPVRLDAKVHFQGDRARKEDSGREENCVVETMLVTVLATASCIPQHYGGSGGI